jgi:hypothetical protein
VKSRGAATADLQCHVGAGWIPAGIHLKEGMMLMTLLTILGALALSLVASVIIEPRSPADRASERRQD